MKYDSGMTQFRKDIIAALRYMLKDDSEITEKFDPGDGTTAPLRDYLKTFYSKSFDEPVSDKLRFTCTPTNFKIAFDDMLLNNKGEKELTMTWSQVAKFIRDNWDEVFKKDKPKSRPLETLVRTFDETEITCPNWLPGKTITYLEAVNGVHFECKAFSAEFCKLDDITDFLVQRCYNPQECPYCKDSAERQPSYIDKLREKYPKVNETGYCPSELFDGDGVNDPGDAKCDYTTKDFEACKKCWRERCPEKISFIENEDFEKEYFENYPEEESSDKNVPKESTICDDCINNDENCIKPSEDKCIGYTSESDTILNPAPESKPTYKDIFLKHYPDFDVSRFDEFAESLCVACCFDDGGAACPFPGNDECKTHWESECLFEWRDKTDEYDLETIKGFLIEKPLENETAESTAKTAVAVQDKNPKIQAAFDYSELDSDTAKNLRDCETVIRQETAGYFTLLGAKFKEAQDLLANHANGTFEKWYTAMGFKRQTVYNLIQRYDFLGSPTIGGREDTFEALPLTLSYELSKPDAPAELVEKVLDGDITTNAEYIKLKAELEEANKRAETEKKAREAISQNLSNMEEGYREFKDKYTEEYYKNADLEKRVKELESRPVDVAVQDNSDLMEELEELREENARLKDDSVKSMVIRLTLDEYDKLLEKLGGDPCLGHIIKHAKIIKL